jgi:hypothetical protein
MYNIGWFCPFILPEKKMRRIEEGVTLHIMSVLAWLDMYKKELAVSAWYSQVFGALSIVLLVASGLSIDESEAVFYTLLGGAVLSVVMFILLESVKERGSLMRYKRTRIAEMQKRIEQEHPEVYRMYNEIPKR